MAGSLGASKGQFALHLGATGRVRATLTNAPLITGNLYEIGRAFACIGIDARFEGWTL
jgi:hypothetical protein